VEVRPWVLDREEPESLWMVLEGQIWGFLALIW
jgi:hypothetical protein